MAETEQEVFIDIQSFKGRKMIMTDTNEITRENLSEVLRKAMSIHISNRGQIDKLFKYEKGIQNILYRVKDVRPEINNKIVENHAHEIVNFKVGYTWGQPVSYVQRANKDISNTEDGGDSVVNTLNEMFFEEGKHQKDQELARMFSICGVGYRLITPYKIKRGVSDFRLTNLDPRNTFVVYSADVFHDPKMGVTYWTDDDNVNHYTIYTENKVFMLTSFDDVSGIITDKDEMTEKTNGIGCIPIVEYKNDDSRMGCFERVLGLLEAINLCTSDRLNGLAQFVQSLLWFNNIDIDTNQFKELREEGGIATKSQEGKEPILEYIKTELNQTEIQSLADYLYSQLLQITGTPARGQSSGGNTGVALMLGESGWQLAEENAQASEVMFSASEREMLKVVKNIVERSKDNDISEMSIADIDIKFNRNKISNLLNKTQALTNLQSAGINMRHAIKTVDLFADPQQVYMDSLETLEKNVKEQTSEKDENEQLLEKNNKEQGV